MVANKVEFNKRNQFLYSIRPGSVKVFGKIVFGDAGAVGDYSEFHGVKTVTKVGGSTTGKYRIELTSRFLDLVGFSGATSGVTDGDGYDVVLIDEFVQGFGAAVTDDAYQDGYLHIQFFQGGTQKDPVDTTAYLEFTMKTSEQG